MESSQFSDSKPRFDAIERLDTQGAICDTFRVKLYGKLHFLKRLKAECSGDIRYQEALRKEFETGYRLEHPNLVRYISIDDDGILMDYVDGETLSQRLSCNPEFFNNRKYTDKFLRQLLSVIGYLHSNQVLHLDLKPDNILLTRINDVVKLTDLGCCYTDTFTDTSGFTKGFAAPEQLKGGQIDARTDFYAFGKILELLPNHYIYNKVIARCTAEKPDDRYPSINEILHDINHQRRYYLWVAAFVAVALVLSVGMALFTHQPEQPQKSILPIAQKDSVSTVKADSAVQPNNEIRRKANKIRPISMKEDLEKQMNKAYLSTIATFCDSSFPSPSPTTRTSWTNATTEFHNKTLNIIQQLQKKYPNSPEATIQQEAESSFQNLTSFVFSKMRENGQNRK